MQTASPCAIQAHPWRKCGSLAANLQAGTWQVDHRSVRSHDLDTRGQRRTKGGIDFDASQAPYYVIRFAPTVTDADVEGVLASMRVVWKLRQKIVVLCDVSDSSLTPLQRKLITAEMKRDQDSYSHWIDSWASVVRTALARRTLTALTWMFAPPFEMRVFNQLEDASAWAAQRLAELHPQR